MNRHRLEPLPSKLGEEDFVAVYGGVYEHSPWIARQTWRRGLTAEQDTVEGLSDAMKDTVEAAAVDRQLELIRAHPDLAGRAALSGRLSTDSSREQSGAGIDQCTAEELERFQHLNRTYWERFGFPFVMAVRGSDRHRILAAFEARLANTADTERAVALEQIHRIARLRLMDHAAKE